MCSCNLCCVDKHSPAQDSNSQYQAWEAGVLARRLKHVSSTPLKVLGIGVYSLHSICTCWLRLHLHILYSSIVVCVRARKHGRGRKREREREKEREEEEWQLFALFVPLSMVCILPPEASCQSQDVPCLFHNKTMNT